ncbi:MAG: TonB family protein [Flavobacteriales bacterium]|nr:TonB family protein [Flavobacteriales bacterium]
MKNKKLNKLQSDDLYSKSVYALTGLILILASILCVFEYKAFDNSNVVLTSSLTNVEDETIVELKVILPPKPKQIIEPIQKPDHVKVVDDKKQIPPDVVQETIDSVFENLPDLNITDSDLVIEQIFEVVEQNPQFVGGMKKLYEYLSKNIKYPEVAKENGIQGKVFVQFIICKDGKIESAKIVKGIHSSINNEALKVVKSMPNWIPGKQRGVPVKTRFTLPIKFRIS